MSRRVTRAGDLAPRAYTAGGRPPAFDVADVPPVRVTAYLRPEHVAQLRAEAARRFAMGRRADVSMLIREAVERAFMLDTRDAIATSAARAPIRSVAAITADSLAAAMSKAVADYAASLKAKP